MLCCDYLGGWGGGVYSRRITFLYPFYCIHSIHHRAQVTRIELQLRSEFSRGDLADAVRQSQELEKEKLTLVCAESVPANVSFSPAHCLLLGKVLGVPVVFVVCNWVL